MMTLYSSTCVVFESDVKLRKEVAWVLVLEECARLEWLMGVTDLVYEDADLNFELLDA
jgi:hypothetical protein